MAQLWTELTAQASHKRDDFVPQRVVADIGPRRAVVICPVNAESDFASYRNAILFKERFENAWEFDGGVIVEESARSSQAKPSAAIVAVLGPTVEKLLSSCLHQQKPQPLSFLVVYVTCSTPVDVAEIYDNLASTILSHPSSAAGTKAVVIVDAPCVAPLQVAPGAQLPIPLLVPKPDFDGHIALKFLHAAHDCGDEGEPVTLEAVASRITPIALLMGSAPPDASVQSFKSLQLQQQQVHYSRLHPSRVPWNAMSCCSTQPVTFLVCASVMPRSEAALNAIDGRSVGKALKQQMPSGRLRYLIEKEQGIVLNFCAEDTGRPPEQILSHEDAAPEFEAAMLGSGASKNAALAVILPSADRRFHAAVPVTDVHSVFRVIHDDTPENNGAEAKMGSAGLIGGIRLIVPRRIPQKSFYCSAMALSYKYEATASYRAYLLLEALVRLRVPSPEHKLRIEDLTPPVAAAEGVDAGSVPPFMFLRAATLSAPSPQRRALANASVSQAMRDQNSTIQNVSTTSSAHHQLAGSGHDPHQQQDFSVVSPAGASVQRGMKQHQQSPSPQQQQQLPPQSGGGSATAMMVSREEQLDMIRQVTREQLEQSVPQYIQRALESNNTELSDHFARALEDLRKEFRSEIKKASESMAADVRSTEARWKKHLLLVEQRLQQLEEFQQQTLFLQQQQQQQQQQGGLIPNSRESAIAGSTSASASPEQRQKELTVSARREIATAMDSLALPIQQLDQKVVVLAAKLESAGERIVSLEQLASSNQRSTSRAQEEWMAQRDQMLQRFTTDLTNNLELRLRGLVPEQRVAVLEERMDAISEAAGVPPEQLSASPSRALSDRIGGIEATADAAKRACAALEARLAQSEEHARRIVAASSDAIKTDLSTSVNRFSADLSQRLVGFLNENITRINDEVGRLKATMAQQALDARRDSSGADSEMLQASITRSAADIRDLRHRIQQMEIVSQSSTLAEQDKSKMQRIFALEEQVARMTSTLRALQGQ